MPYHMHNTYELYFVASGKCRFSVFRPETGKHVHLRLKSGDCVFTDADVFHRVQVDGDGCRLIELEFKALDRTPDSVDPSVVIRQCEGLTAAFTASDHIHLTENDLIRPAVDRITSLLNSDRKYVDHPYTQTLINELLFNIDRCYSHIYLDNHYIRKTIDFIMANYTEDLSVELIAQGVRLNPSYLQKIFKTTTGMTVWEYLKRHRIERAISLIKNTRMSFTDISFEVGFSNRQTFFNVFKDIMGVTPSQYKKYLASPHVRYSSSDYRAEVTIDDRLKKYD